MKKRTFLFVISTLLCVSFTLTACGLFQGTQGTGGQQYSAEELATMSAATISARLTQISIETLIAQATQLALVTNTPIPTSTPLPTATSTMVPTATNTPVPPTATPIPIPCNLAEFVTDVSVKDGTEFVAGDQFTKTWRIKNIGSCSWTTSYSLYFYSGNSMSGPASIAIPGTIKPGHTVDLTVSLVAPANTGDFTGNWMLKSSQGAVFGVGPAGNVPLSVVIKVKSLPKPKDPNIVYDFVANYCKAQWRTNAGFISCPSTGLNTKNGSITRTYAPVLENKQLDDEGAIITVPAKGGDGMIQGQYPKMVIHSGDFFAASLFCSGGATKCDVTYTVLYKESGSTTINELGTWAKHLDGSVVYVFEDLSALDGKEIIFYLKVISGGDSTDDYANWMAARITHP